MLEKESVLILLQDVFKYNNLDKRLGINWKNLRKVDNEPKVYRITADKISLTSLIYLVEHESIEDVYFHPSVAPPRDGIQSTAMRYHLYIKFL